jgi:hypothetical protein
MEPHCFFGSFPETIDVINYEELLRLRNMACACSARDCSISFVFSCTTWGDKQDTVEIGRAGTRNAPCSVYPSRVQVPLVPPLSIEVVPFR